MCNLNLFSGFDATRIFPSALFLLIVELTVSVASGINHHEHLAQLKVPQCRQDCLHKVSAAFSPHFGRRDGARVTAGTELMGF